MCWLKRATPRGAAAQHGVGGGRAIGGDDLDRLLAVDVAVDFPEDVEQLTVHLGLVLVAPVAQEVVELLQRLFVIAAVALEGDGEVFVGMGVVEGEGAGLVQRRGVVNRAGSGKEQQRAPSRRSSRCLADDRAVRSGARRQPALLKPTQDDDRSSDPCATPRSERE